MAKKSKPIFRHNEDNTNHWQRWVSGRYVFFSSLFSSPENWPIKPEVVDEATRLRLERIGMYARNKLSSFSRDKEDKDLNNSEYITYMETYIKMLQSLIEQERMAEEAFFNAVQEQLDGFDVKKYFSGNKFDYISFIADINKILQNENLVKENISRNINNFNLLKDARAHYIEEALNDLQNNKTAEEINKELKQIYAHKFKNYKELMRKELKDKSLQQSMAEEVSIYINQQIQNIIQDSSFVQLLENNFPTLTGPQLLNIIINRVADQLANYESGPLLKENIKEYLTQNISNIAQLAQEDYFNSANNVLSNTNNSNFRKALERALKGAGELAKTLEDDMMSFKDILAVLQPNATTEEQQKLIEYYSALYDAKAKAYGRLSVLRSNLTRYLNQLLKKYNPNQQWGEIKDKESITNAIDAILSDPNIKFNTPLKSARDYLGNAKITIPSMAEILSMPGVMNRITSGVLSTVLGTTIQLKADVIINISPGRTPTIDMGLEKLSSDELADILLPPSFQQRFMTELKERTANSTNVEEAAKIWRELKESERETETKLLSKVRGKQKKQDIESFFKNSVNGQISVKEYSFFMPEYGYKGGSLGGSGRVTEVVPQILKMLELGGITISDADLITSILLNSFDESVIGMSLFSEIEALLIGGAAMMMFDDGFANAKAFLEQMSSELHMNLEPRTVHLLYLNGIYIPQSYALQMIVDRLIPIINDIVSAGQTDKNVQGAASLSLNNPVGSGMLAEVNNMYPKIEQSVNRWNEMAFRAEQQVTVRFLFMAGMLDVMEELGRAFDIV